MQGKLACGCLLDWTLEICMLHDAIFLIRIWLKVKGVLQKKTTTEYETKVNLQEKYSNKMTPLVLAKNNVTFYALS